MTTYVTQSEVRSLWGSSLERMITECRSNRKVPEGLLELIKHNLFAKYASYDADLDQIEIGVNESKQRTQSYPVISVYKLSLDEVVSSLTNSCQAGRRDMEFYARILKGQNSGTNVFVL